MHDSVDGADVERRRRRAVPGGVHSRARHHVVRARRRGAREVRAPGGEETKTRRDRGRGLERSRRRGETRKVTRDVVPSRNHRRHVRRRDAVRVARGRRRSRRADDPTPRFTRLRRLRHRPDRREVIIYEFFTHM